jgi:uncharacterized protein YbjT (DUF2867 family)
MEVTMYVILGASGNTGHVVAKMLLGRGKKVRVVGRSTAHLQPLIALGADAFIADVSDAAALTKAFGQADSAYVLIPPDSSSADYRVYQDRVSDAIAAAAGKAGLENIVSLSSFGAAEPSGTGPVVGLHNMEQKLSQLSANVLHLRPGYFMENTLAQVAAIRTTGMAISPVRPDLKLPFIATQDIGAAAADALTELTFRGKSTQELHGQRNLDYNEATQIIGDAIGQPNLQYILGSNEQVRGALAQLGMSENRIGLILEMAAALNSGLMRALEPRTPQSTTPTPYESFVAQKFIPAYQHQVAA